jgi:hypothetical protein
MLKATHHSYGRDGQRWTCEPGHIGATSVNGGQPRSPTVYRRGAQEPQRLVAAGDMQARLAFTAEVMESYSLPLHAQAVKRRRPIQRLTSSASRHWWWYCADLPEQAQSVPVDPLFNEFAIDNSAEELSIYIH